MHKFSSPFLTSSKFTIYEVMQLRVTSFQTLDNTWSCKSTFKELLLEALWLNMRLASLKNLAYSMMLASRKWDQFHGDLVSRSSHNSISWVSRAALLPTHFTGGPVRVVQVGPCVPRCYSFWTKQLFYFSMKYNLLFSHACFDGGFLTSLCALMVDSSLTYQEEISVTRPTLSWASSKIEECV